MKIREAATLAQNLRPVIYAQIKKITTKMTVKGEIFYVLSLVYKTSSINVYLHEAQFKQSYTNSSIKHRLRVGKLEAKRMNYKHYLQIKKSTSVNTYKLIDYIAKEK